MAAIEEIDLPSEDFIPAALQKFNQQLVHECQQHLRGKFVSNDNP